MLSLCFLLYPFPLPRANAHLACPPMPRRFPAGAFLSGVRNANKGRVRGERLSSYAFSCPVPFLSAAPATLMGVPTARTTH